MASVDREAIQTIIQEMDHLLSLRHGFVNEYRAWRATATERVAAATSEEVAREFETKGPRDTPINRQHRVHNYRQTLVAQIRFLNQVLEEDSE